MAVSKGTYGGALLMGAFVAAHRVQLSSSGIPEYFWPTVFRKVRETVFDAGQCFQLLRFEDNEEEDEPEAIGRQWKVIVTEEKGMEPNDPNRIYLIDHAWTYRPNEAREQLQQIPGLLQRMCELMDIVDDDDDDQEYQLRSATARVLREMWKYNQTYSINAPGIDAESAVPIWYIMDEFGSRIQHSDEPSFRVVPFYDVFSQVSYSLLFPIRSVPAGGEVTRDYVEGPAEIKSDVLLTKALKQPWFPSDMTDLDFHCAEPPLEYYLSSRQNETLPVPCTAASNDASMPQYTLPLKVYSEYEPICSTLKDSRFVIVDNEDDADILWYSAHFKDYKSFGKKFPEKFINQFPYESVVTIKDFLNVVCRSRITSTASSASSDAADHAGPAWLPVTFNLKTELPQFVSYFQRREKLGLDNHWICKPWNLARGLDIQVTNNLAHIIRLFGPKVCCKYVEDPVLFRRDDLDGIRVKFDIRYIVLLQNVDPLKVFVYRRFWVRFANQQYSLDALDNYETHFTVMNYRDTEMRQMFCNDFVQQLESQHTGLKYHDDVETDIFKMLKEVFVAATSEPPPRGIAPSCQSRAVYGVDVMLDWSRQSDGSRRAQPLLLEVNYAPDCLRACEYYEDFYDDVFSVLFLEDTEDRHVVQL